MEQDAVHQPIAAAVSPRLKGQGPELVYEVGRRFANLALAQDDSLFTSGTAIWSLLVIEDLYQRFVQHPDTSQDNFVDKFKRQLEGSPPETVQLAGELLFVYFTPVADIGAPAKRDIIGKVLSWSSSPVHVPADLDPVLEHGIIGYGPAIMQRPFQLAFILEFLRKLKRLSQEERMSALADGWKFKALLLATPAGAAAAQQQALLALVFPDTFEPIISNDWKRRIVARFSSLAADTAADDVDRMLASIRVALSKEYGASFTFYDPKLRQLWDPPTSGWDAFVFFSRRFREWSGFDDDERNYKLEAADAVRALRDAVLRDDVGWQGVLKTALSGPQNNLLPWQAVDDFRRWCAQNEALARDALKRFWTDTSDVAARCTAFLREIPSVAFRGQPAPFLSVLLMGEDPLSFPPFRPTPFAKAFELTGFQGPGSTDPVERYLHALQFLNELRSQAESRGVELRDRLDAQSVTWAITKADVAREPIASWPVSERTAFQKFRGEIIEEVSTEEEAGGLPGGGNERPPDGLKAVAERLYLDAEYLVDWIDLLRDKRQIIFYGPPGTGKTYIAQALMEFLAPSPDARDIVQFHPSYSYEDFIQGYRPITSAEGVIGYELKDGPLRRLAERARNSEVGHVLLIDEINRGNLPRIFGELLFLLEYRDRDVSLMYESEGRRFKLPENLLVIGTMNTADRSIALVDAALRRRFHFIPLFPGKDALKGILDRWLGANVPAMQTTVVEVVDRLNGKLADRFKGQQVSLGHSYFMKRNLDERELRRIWSYDVMPFLEEQLFGEAEELKNYELDSLRRSRGEDDHAEGIRDEPHPVPGDEAGA